MPSIITATRISTRRDCSRAREGVAVVGVATRNALHQGARHRPPLYGGGYENYSFTKTFSGTTPRSKAEMVLSCSYHNMRYYMRYENGFRV
jgi:hypothetical protein